MVLWEVEGLSNGLIVLTTSLGVDELMSSLILNNDLWALIPGYGNPNLPVLTGPTNVERKVHLDQILVSSIGPGEIIRN